MFLCVMGFPAFFVLFVCVCIFLSYDMAYRRCDAMQCSAMLRDAGAVAVFVFCVSMKRRCGAMRCDAWRYLILWYADDIHFVFCALLDVTLLLAT